MTDKKLLRIEGLSKTFHIKSRKLFEKAAPLKAVDDVSFDVYEGETLGIIGESGCGKSTLGRALIQLNRPTEGRIYYDDKDLTTLKKKELRAVRKDIQMVFQDPYASLDPRKTILSLIREPMDIHGIGTTASRNKRVEELLVEVGLDALHTTRYPHEFSGGQRQRINVARALALDPKIVVCDEPVSALDVSVQARVLNMMQRVQKKYGLTYIFISHDLSVVKYISDRVLIMYLGEIVETGTAEAVYQSPKHPYTKALFAAIPPESPFEEKAAGALVGDIPSPLNRPAGCALASRCPKAMSMCSAVKPTLKSVDGTHMAACHLYETEV